MTHSGGKVLIPGMPGIRSRTSGQITSYKKRTG